MFKFNHSTKFDIFLDFAHFNIHFDNIFPDNIVIKAIASRGNTP